MAIPAGYNLSKRLGANGYGSMLTLAAVNDGKIAVAMLK